MQFKVSKGLNVPINGSINVERINSVSARSVALLGEDYHGLKPTMLVQEGNVVIKGENLFEDKKNPGVKFTSPISGKIVEINRGERRTFLSMVIEKNINSTSEVSFESFQDISKLSKDLVIENLIESGVWTSFRTRPFSKIPKINDEPEEIFISLISSDPLSLDPEYYLKKHIDDFNFGLEVISYIPKNCVHISTSSTSNFSKITSDKIQYHDFDGIHPVGLVGTQIHRISPVSLNRTVWTINYQDVSMIGRLFKTGSLATTRMVAFCGPQVETPCLIETEIGASISEVSAGKTLQGNNRFISYLPLNHIFERICIEWTCLRYGGSISFVESLETFGQNLQDVEPTTFAGVPRIYTKFQEKILAKMSQKILNIVFPVLIHLFI